MAKLGYFSWGMNLTGNIGVPVNTMFIGFDVCHDKKFNFAWGNNKKSSDNSRVSVVGFVASYNSRFDSYNSWITCQIPKMEYVELSKELLIQALHEYKNYNKKYPDNLIIFRDGVGKSQLRAFVEFEIKNFDRACEYCNISPKITMLVIQKSGNTRFSTLDEKKQYQNLPVGTIVDQKITSKGVQEFFITSTRGIKGGTNRPTHYIVVRNDSHLSSNTLEMLSYNMCYLYQNWQGSIKVPAPCMYAHKIAYLFGKFLYGNPQRNIADKLFYL